MEVPTSQLIIGLLELATQVHPAVLGDVSLGVGLVVYEGRLHGVPTEGGADQNASWIVEDTKELFWGVLAPEGEEVVGLDDRLGHLEPELYCGIL